MNVEIDIVSEEMRMRPQGSEVYRLYGDNSRLLDLTSWKPSYGGLDGFRRGLAVTAQWFSDPVNLSRYRTGTYAL